jgi:hypothetical protein
MTTKDLVIVNGTDRDWTRGRYVLWFGEISPHYLMVWANGLDSALDKAVDWVADNAPGLLADESVAEEYQAAIAEGLEPEAAFEKASVDTTCAGNNGHYLLSWHWGILFENPSRVEIKSWLAETGAT